MYIPELSSSYNGHTLHLLFYSSGHQIKLVDGALKVNVHLIHHVDGALKVNVHLIHQIKLC